MTQKTKLFALAFAASICLGYAAWATLTAPTFRACKSNEAQARANQTEKQLGVRAVGFGDSAEAIGVCAWNMFSQQRDAYVAVATVFIAFFTATLWWSTSAMQEVTTATLKHLGSEFKAEHRPWVCIEEVKAVGDIRWSDFGAHLTVVFTLRNAGRTPALRAWPRGAIFPFFSNGDKNDLPNDQLRFAASLAIHRESAGVVGITISPGQTVEQRNVFLMSKTDTEAYRDWIANQSGLCTLILAGEVTYAMVLDYSEPMAGFVFEVWKENTDWVEPTNVQGRTIVFSPSIFGSGITD